MEKLALGEPNTEKRGNCSVTYVYVRACRNFSLFLTYNSSSYGKDESRGKNCARLGRRKLPRFVALVILCDNARLLCLSVRSANKTVVFRGFKSAGTQNKTKTALNRRLFALWRTRGDCPRHCCAMLVPLRSFAALTGVLPPAFRL